MTPHALSYNEFFHPRDFRFLADYAHRANYKIEKGWDGVDYPNICAEIPEPIQEALELNLTWAVGHRVVNKMTFLRLSTEGVAAPHWAHTDGELSHFAFFMHLNWGKGATALLRHIETGLNWHPENEAAVELWKQDTNNYHAWEQDTILEGAPNRAIIIPAAAMHAALPMSGMGTDAKNGRLVLISFFD